MFASLKLTLLIKVTGSEMVSRISTFQVVGGAATCVALVTASGAIAVVGAAMAVKLLPIALVAFLIGLAIARDFGPEAAPLMACMPFVIGLLMLPTMGLTIGLYWWNGMAFAAAAKLELLSAVVGMSVSSFFCSPLALGIFLRNLGRDS